MDYLLRAALLIAALIHLAPAVGVLGPKQLQRLYGIPIEGADLGILMRHRAMLFGMLGLLLLAAIFVQGLQLAALLLGLGSVASFLFIAHARGGYNAALSRLVRVDWFALVALLLGLAAWFLSGGPARP